MNQPAAVFDLDSTYLHLPDGPAMSPVPVDEKFWAEINTRADIQDGRLVMLFHSAEDWGNWEMHPAGDELVYLLNGAVDLILEQPDGEAVVELRDRAACIVPAGIWHRAIVHQPSNLLHITRGAGTKHRPV